MFHPREKRWKYLSPFAIAMKPSYYRRYLTVDRHWRIRLSDKHFGTVDLPILAIYPCVGVEKAISSGQTKGVPPAGGTSSCVRYYSTFTDSLGFHLLQTSYPTSSAFQIPSIFDPTPRWNIASPEQSHRPHRFLPRASAQGPNQRQVPSRSGKSLLAQGMQLVRSEEYARDQRHSLCPRHGSKVIVAHIDN